MIWNKKHYFYTYKTEGNKFISNSFLNIYILSMFKHLISEYEEKDNIAGQLLAKEILTDYILANLYFKAGKVKQRYLYLIYSIISISITYFFKLHL